jgi:eukaryotic-like serine/threonine-protein kinase
MDEQNSPTPDPWIGKTIENRYEIIRELGFGGMGVVYEGRDLVLKRPVAVKKLHEKLAKSQEILERFRREAIAASDIGNEHIIQVYDIFLDHSPPFMLLEFLKGVSLDRDITDNRQSLKRVARILIQVCDALTAVHKRNIIHRDLKPQNIFLISKESNPDFVKVLDFGIARVQTSVLGQAEEIDKPGCVMGTPEFMSPEQCMGRMEEIDPRTDIYALGAILYFSLTGTPPFIGVTEYEIMIKHCQDAPPSVSKWRTDLPQQIDGIIAKAMAKKPEERFADVAEFKTALWYYSGISHSSPAITPISFPPISVRPLEATPGVRKRWVVPAIIGGAAVATGLVGAALYLGNKPNPSSPGPQRPSMARHVDPAKRPAAPKPPRGIGSLSAPPAGARSEALPARVTPGRVTASGVRPGRTVKAAAAREVTISGSLPQAASASPPLVPSVSATPASRASNAVSAPSKASPPDAESKVTKGKKYKYAKTLPEDDIIRQQ